MKSGIHPEFRLVVFRDTTCDFEFICGSTMDPKNFAGTTEVDGVEYPIVKIDISSASHPFFTGKQKVSRTQGRVEKFLKKYGMAAEEPAS